MARALEQIVLAYRLWFQAQPYLMAFLPIAVIGASSIFATVISMHV